MMAKSKDDDTPPRNGNGNGVPKFGVPWLDACAYVATRFGIASVFAAFLCWAVIMPLRDAYIESMREIAQAVREIKTCEANQIERDAAQNEKQARHFEACTKEHADAMKAIEREQSLIAGQGDVLKANQQVHLANQKAIIEILKKIGVTLPDPNG